jgi:hypothetical protein
LILPKKKKFSGPFNFRFYLKKKNFTSAFCASTCSCIFNFYFTYMTLFQDLIAENIRLRARVGVLEDAVAALEAKLSEATATTGLWQYMLAGVGAALVLELLARPVWVRCTGRQFPLDRVLDRVVSPVVEKTLVASHLAWARLLAAAIYVLRRRRSETVEVGVLIAFLLFIYIPRLVLRVEKNKISNFFCI